MDKLGWILSRKADIADAQGTVHHGLPESLVVVETESLDPATRHLPFSAESFAAWSVFTFRRQSHRSLPAATPLAMS